MRQVIPNAAYRAMAIGSFASDDQRVTSPDTFLELTHEEMKQVSGGRLLPVRINAPINALLPGLPPRSTWPGPAPARGPVGFDPSSRFWQR